MNKVYLQSILLVAGISMISMIVSVQLVFPSIPATNRIVVKSQVLLPPLNITSSTTTTTTTTTTVSTTTILEQKKLSIYIVNTTQPQTSYSVNGVFNHSWRGYMLQNVNVSEVQGYLIAPELNRSIYIEYLGVWNQSVLLQPIVSINQGVNGEIIGGEEAYPIQPVMDLNMQASINSGDLLFMSITKEPVGWHMNLTDITKSETIVDTNQNLKLNSFSNLYILWESESQQPWTNSSPPFPRFFNSSIILNGEKISIPNNITNNTEVSLIT